MLIALLSASASDGAVVVCDHVLSFAACQTCQTEQAEQPEQTPVVESAVVVVLVHRVVDGLDVVGVLWRRRRERRRHRKDGERGRNGGRSDCLTHDGSPSFPYDTVVDGRKSYPCARSRKLLRCTTNRRSRTIRDEGAFRSVASRGAAGRTG